MIKWLALLLVILLSLTIIDCKTVEYVYPKYTYPEQPERFYIAPELDKTFREDLELENYKLLGLLIASYEGLLQEWEQWAKSVIELTTHKEE